MNQDLPTREPLPSMERCFPNSHRVYSEVQHESFTLRIPRRRIHLAEGAEHLDVYDEYGEPCRTKLMNVAGVLNQSRTTGRVKRKWISSR